MHFFLQMYKILAWCTVCANICSSQTFYMLSLCKWQNISYLILYTQCNIDKDCCCQGLACVHCIFMLWHMYPHFHLKLKYIAIFTSLSMWIWSRCGGDRMVVGITTTSAISTYHSGCCEYTSRSEWGVQHNVIKFVSDLWQVMIFSGSSINKTDHHYINEILLKVVLNNINVVLTWHIWSELQTVYTWFNIVWIGKLKYCFRFEIRMDSKVSKSLSMDLNGP